MKHLSSLFFVVLVVTLLPASDAYARGGGGAKGGGGGGGARTAGHSPAGGGAAHTPSMSRPAGKPVASKPAARPQINKPNIGNGGPPSRPDVGKPKIGGKRPDIGANKPDLSGNRPNRGDKKPDLSGNRPNLADKKPDLDGNHPNLGDKKPGSGNRPDFSGNNRPSTGDLNDFLDLPGQPSGGAGLGNRPNIDDKANIGDKINIGDKSKVGDKLNIGDNNTIGNKTNIGNNTRVGDVNINAGNNVSINRQNNINSIHNKYNNNNYRRPFGAGYWGGANIAGPGWRWQAGWNNYPGNWCWRPCPWAAFGTWFAWQWAQPMNYNYGTTVVYRDNYVYIDEKQIASSEQYYQQATTIAQSSPPGVDESKVEWMPLGVFAVTEDHATDSGMMVQLAVSKEGIIAGTFFNEIANISRPVEGMVDRETQRAAWRFADGKNADVVMETGISNLTKDDATALVHFGPDKAQTWLMVRLPAPEEETQQ